MPIAMSENTSSETREPESLEALFVAYEGPLLRYAYRLVQDRDISQEIVQETFMRLHANIDQVEKPRPWLYRTVHNLAVNHHRSGQKIVPLEFEEEGGGLQVPIDGAMRPDEQIERLEAIEQTRRCLQTLDPRGRELIRLKFEEDLSYQQMSQRTGLTVSNVGYILHHALKHLASELENMGVRL
jgi:RNA polymerase sigma factor (sigma-70 family)